MYIKSITLAILMVILPFSVFAAGKVQHKLASVVLSDVKASYMIKTSNESVSVVTFDYQSADKSCKFLLGKGVNVLNVKNYEQDEKTGTITSTYKDC